MRGAGLGEPSRARRGRRAAGRGGVSSSTPIFVGRVSRFHRSVLRKRAFRRELRGSAECRARFQPGGSRAGLGSLGPAAVTGGWGCSPWSPFMKVRGVLALGGLRWVKMALSSLPLEGAVLELSGKKRRMM